MPWIGNARIAGLYARYSPLLLQLGPSFDCSAAPWNRPRAILDRKGFECRIRGDHFIFTHPKAEEIINLQPIGSMAKPYQVKQVRDIIVRYGLAEE
jgi:hypothetical protein